MNILPPQERNGHLRPGKVSGYEAGKSDTQKKIAAATYRYQADCDGEWGEIQFDFEKRKAKILHLADWDTSRTKLYAKRVIGRILRTGGNDFPKKERIVFER